MFTACGNGHADMVRANPLAGGSDFLLRLAGRQGKDLIAEAWRTAIAVGNRQDAARNHRCMRATAEFCAPLILSARSSSSQLPAGRSCFASDKVDRDPDARFSEVWLHTLAIPAENGSWQNACEAGPDGRRQGFPLAGRVRKSDAQFVPAEPGTFEVTCTGGAQGKCVRFGYVPWAAPEGLALYNACVRMMRADYCGTGEPHTRPGTPIEIYENNIGAEGKIPAAEMELEAIWGPQGAICVRHVRLSEIFSLDQLLARCPRLKPEDLGAGCAEERMQHAPDALLMNRSVVK